MQKKKKRQWSEEEGRNGSFGEGPGVVRQWKLAQILIVGKIKSLNNIYSLWRNHSTLGNPDQESVNLFLKGWAVDISGSSATNCLSQ